ncbi:MAG: BMP family ABC transporter substrate-binding protein [Rubellimicrobium sp.]|nr:BMP family ABC transporter substrate-binding protein [Rubellimicrobium sp.]
MTARKLLSGLIATAGTLALSTGLVAAEDEVRVAAISGYFSQGFGISIMQGLEQAQADLGIDLTIVDTGNRALDYEEQFNNLAQGSYDLIFVMGWELVDALSKTAEANPDTRFIFIDGVLEGDTMTYIDFLEEEGSYMVGALAGLLAQEGVAPFANGPELGFVGGRDIPVIRNFLMGMQQGVADNAPDVRVVDVFAGTFDDPAKGSELAMALFGQGIGTIYQAAGPTGEGVLQAAAAAGAFAVGVDIDQCPSAPGAMLGSMLKRADIAVYDVIEGHVTGTAPVVPGTVQVGVASGGVELKICEDILDQIPQDILDQVEAIREGIVSGEIAVALND